eukprot:gene17441-19185_t
MNPYYQQLRGYSQAPQGYAQQQTIQGGQNYQPQTSQTTTWSHGGHIDRSVPAYHTRDQQPRESYPNTIQSMQRPGITTTTNQQQMISTSGVQIQQENTQSNFSLPQSRDNSAMVNQGAPGNAMQGMGAQLPSPVGTTSLGDESLEALNNQRSQLEVQMKKYQSDYEKWHKEFSAWKKQHENHPDQKQYIQYQQKYQAMIQKQQQALQQQYIELQRRIKQKQSQQMPDQQQKLMQSNASHWQTQQNVLASNAQDIAVINANTSVQAAQTQNQPTNLPQNATVSLPSSSIQKNHLSLQSQGSQGSHRVNENSDYIQRNQLHSSQPTTFTHTSNQQSSMNNADQYPIWSDANRRTDNTVVSKPWPSDKQMLDNNQSQPPQWQAPSQYQSSGSYSNDPTVLHWSSNKQTSSNIQLSEPQSNKPLSNKRPSASNLPQSHPRLKEPSLHNTNPSLQSRNQMQLNQGRGGVRPQRHPTPPRGHTPVIQNQAQAKLRKPAPIPSLMSQNIANTSKYEQIAKTSSKPHVKSVNENNSQSQNYPMSSSQSPESNNKPPQRNQQQFGTGISHEQQQSNNNFWEDDVSGFTNWDVNEPEFHGNQPRSQHNVFSQPKSMESQPSPVVRQPITTCAGNAVFNANVVSSASLAVSATVTSCVTLVHFSSSNSKPITSPIINQCSPSSGTFRNTSAPRSGPTSGQAVRPTFAPRTPGSIGFRGPRPNVRAAGNFTQNNQKTMPERSNEQRHSTMQPKRTPLRKVSEKKMGKCKFFPNCRYGSKCKFNHPDCLNCDDRNCILEHRVPPSGTENDFSSSGANAEAEEQSNEYYDGENQRYQESGGNFDASNNRMQPEWQRDYYEEERSIENEHVYNQDYSEGYNDDYDNYDNYDNYQQHDYPPDYYDEHQYNMDESRPHGPGFTAAQEPGRGEQAATNQFRQTFDDRGGWELQTEAERMQPQGGSYRGPAQQQPPYDGARDVDGFGREPDPYNKPYSERSAYQDSTYSRDNYNERPSQPLRPVVFDYGHERNPTIVKVPNSNVTFESMKQYDAPKRPRSPPGRSSNTKRSERRSISPPRRRSRDSVSRSPSRGQRRDRYSTTRDRNSISRDIDDKKSDKHEAVCWSKPNAVAIKDLLEKPGRDARPKQIVIILRGPPGCGKTHIAKIIKDKEVSFGAHAPRILALDDYFITEIDSKQTDKDTGKKVQTKKMEYVYEKEMEPAYRKSLLKSFNKTLENGYFPMIIIDAVNEKVEHFEKFWSDGKHKGFEVFVAEMQGDASDCAEKNVHNWSQQDIQKILDHWEPTPSHYRRLDVRSLVQDAAIEEVEMEEIEQLTAEEKQAKEKEKEEDVDEEECGTFHVPKKSKWEETKEEQLAKLDGIRGKKEKGAAKRSILDDDYDDDPYDEKEEDMRIGRKRVRWADVEERKQLEHRKRIGFCIGTDWSVLTDPNAQVPL